MQLFAPLNRIKGMGRRPRTHFSGAVYHAMARGVNGGDIFVDDQDRRGFLEIVSRVCTETACEVIAYCLMGNHFHLAARVGLVTLSSVMQRIETAHANYFNRRHDREGHLFQARFKANLCLDDRYLAALIPYIHMNPVRAGFVARPQDWPWSSYAGEAINPSDLIDFDPWPNSTEERITTARRYDEEVVDLSILAANAARGAGISLEQLRCRSRLPQFVRARRVLAREAIRQGYSQAAVAKWLCSTRSSVSRYVRESYATTGDLTPISSV